jgi:uncharacterized protein YndB with AHSA1/START domain
MNAIITKRNFNVSVVSLFKAFSQEEYIKQWWGPDGFTNTFHEFNFNDGGKWRFTMHGPDGKGYENESEFEIVEENELVVLHHISKPEYTAEFNFSSNGINSSSLEWRVVFTKEKAYEALKDIIPEKNEENLDRLEKELQKMK